MNRMNFLKSLAATGAATVFAAQRSAGPKTNFRGKRHITDFTHEVTAPPERVFPLLCPVREYEWIDTWACDLIYSESGVAEDNCIFLTDHRGPMIWSVSRYDPPRRIQFVVFAPDRHVMRLNIDLQATDTGTRLHWQRIFTGLTDAGNEQLGQWTQASEKTVASRLEYFLKTGKMLVHPH